MSTPMRRTRSPCCGENDHVNFALRQVGQLGRQAIIPAICEAVSDSDIAAFGTANVTKATAK
jgi:hypothetical protein